MRLTPEKAWNAYVRGNLRISVRFFARLHVIPESTWRREPERGATGVAVKSGGRWRYPEYSAAQARADVDRGKANMGAPMRMTATTDNGCEVSHQKALERILGCPVHYTRAYASYEKGAVENVNRIVRRCFPKGTDFNSLTRRQIRYLEDTINSIHRESLNGETAYACDQRLSKAA